jgi:hypothetical protein
VSNVVVLVDCWQGKPAIWQDLYQNIIHKVNDIQPDLVCLASYNTPEFADSNLAQRNRWFQTFHQVFIDTGLSVPLSKGPEELTDPTILNAKFDCMQIALEERWQLHHVIKNVLQLQVDQIWMFGMAWSMCVKNRPVGYKNLFPFVRQHLNPNMELLTDPLCILDRVPGTDFFEWPNFEKDPDVCYTNGVWKILE